MKLKRVMEELLQEIQDINFTRIYGDVSLDEQLRLLQKSHIKKRQLSFLEKGVMNGR